MTISNKISIPGFDKFAVASGAPAPRTIAIVRNRWAQGAFIAIALFAIYYATDSQSNPFNQDVRLADAFLHGRLYIEHPPDYLELARYDSHGMACKGSEAGCHGYVIEPPLPAVLLTPFVAIFGSNLNQVLVSIMFGAVAMGLFWIAARRMGWDIWLSVAMTVLLALGTDFWWAAGDGSLWQFSHVCSVLFMMAALVEATGRKRPVLVGLLLGLSGLSRLPTFLAFPFFLYLVLRDRYDLLAWRQIPRDRQVISGVLLFGGGLGTMVLLVFLYNYLRFGTIADLGYVHPQYTGGPFAEGRFSISYIPRHIQAIFYQGPSLNENQFPFFKPSVYGMALFMVTPAFLYAFGAPVARVEIAAMVATVLVMIPHVLYATTGYGQFGYRYSLDYLPMLAVLTASGMGYRMSTRKWLIIGLSVFIALWGPLFFFDTRLEHLLGVQWKV
ncbi:MAG: hypothetical protein JO227_24745 [Acetobacteraceae bacterium]|nr:hypothetical protein [Acetobacteraceae bacterium]